MYEPRTPMYISVCLARRDGVLLRKEWLPLPADRTTFAAALEQLSSKLGDFYISHYNVRVPGLSRWMLGNTPLARVNFLAARLQELDADALLKLCALVDSDRCYDDVEQLIQYTYTHKQYELTSTATTEEDLGWLYLNCAGYGEVYEELKECVDPIALGAELAAKQDGQFTGLGYLLCHSGWNTPYAKRETPCELNLTSPLGQDLYGREE